MNYTDWNYVKWNIDPAEELYNEARIALADYRPQEIPIDANVFKAFKDYIRYGKPINWCAITPKKIILNGPATVVMWMDGTKTVVKLKEGDQYDEYTAFTAALAKKIFGGTNYIRRMIEGCTVDQRTLEEKFEVAPIVNQFNNILTTILTTKLNGE